MVQVGRVLVVPREDVVVEEEQEEDVVAEVEVSVPI